MPRRVTQYFCSMHVANFLFWRHYRPIHFIKKILIPQEHKDEHSAGIISRPVFRHRLDFDSVVSSPQLFKSVPFSVHLTCIPPLSGNETRWAWICY